MKTAEEKMKFQIKELLPRLKFASVQKGNRSPISYLGKKQRDLIVKSGLTNKQGACLIIVSKIANTKSVKHQNLLAMCIMLSEVSE